MDSLIGDDVGGAEIVELVATSRAQVLVQAVPSGRFSTLGPRLPALGPPGLRAGELSRLLGRGWSARPTLNAQWQLLERRSPTAALAD
jgi:hypothetical protein